MLQAMERHGHDEDHQGQGGGPHVEVMAGEEAMDGVSHGGQRLRFRGQIAVEFVAFFEEMTGHAEDEFHAEHRDDDEGAGL